MKLITPDLICPLTYQLLRNSSGDSGPELSFDKSASPEHLFSLARVSLAEASKPVLSFKCSWGDYTSSCPPSLIPRDLHPQLPSEEFVMSKLPYDAIGIYHRMFDFSGVRIPFSLFLLALIKHYRVHFSQLGPLSLNKTLCKQGDWFSFAKRRVPSPVYIDDNRSCMKHLNSGFCLIDRRTILNDMVWRHSDAAIDDPRPAAGSFNMADVHHLRAHVVKLRGMPKGVLILSGLSRVWKSRICDPVLRGADGNVMGIYD
ncbi:hypothetical protein Tco_0053826 [Tanacetum coccineum]